MRPNFVVPNPAGDSAVFAPQRDLNGTVCGFNDNKAEVVAMAKWVHVPTPGSNGLLTCAG